jgi:hypothetical protein
VASGRDARPHNARIPQAKFLLGPHIVKIGHSSARLQLIAFLAAWLGSLDRDLQLPGGSAQPPTLPAAHRRFSGNPLEYNHLIFKGKSPIPTFPEPQGENQLAAKLATKISAHLALPLEGN